MFKKIECVFYYMKGKIVQLEVSSSAPEKNDKWTFLEEDARLQPHSDKIAVLLADICKKNKPKKNAVYFCNLESDYLERGEFKGEIEFMMSEKPEYYGFTVKQFEKEDSMIEKRLQKEIRQQIKDERTNKRNKRGKNE